MKRLWYDKPAKIWEEALPLGNGRLGAMVFGKPDKEQIQVNEESIWDGTERDRTNPDASRYLPKIRELLLQGDTEEAERLMKWALSGCMPSMPSYQTLGDVFMTFWNVREVENYRRELDLERAVCTVRFTSGGVEYTREYWVSQPADAMVIRCRASVEHSLNFDVTLSRCKNTYDGCVKIANEGLYLYGNLHKDGLDYGMGILARAQDGTVETIGDHVIVQNATEAVLYFTADCSYHYAGKELPAEETTESFVRKQVTKRLYNLCELSPQEHLQNHIEDYQSLFQRMELTIEGEGRPEEELPTDVLLQKVCPENDYGLIPLYLNYGRYLLISCSRPGNLPANLQGIWNKELKPSWESKYTININTEMNYWLAESANLSECHMPLFDLIHKMVPKGEQVAKEIYGCRGFVAHHNTDLYGDCGLQDRWIPGTYWVMGAAWLCTHMWNHYCYTLDVEFLRESFPVMCKAAAFFVDFLVEKDGYLVTVPSVSPENTFILPNGQKGANTYGVTMDNQILRDLFGQCLKAAEVLGEQNEVIKQLPKLLSKLHPNQIAADGTLMEWQEDYPALDKGHRHISHLYGLHPSEQITPDITPELARAAERTLEERLANGGGHTGWSRAWIINHYSKLRKGDEAYRHLILLLQKSTYPNLFDCHPPFQIDGNFGAAAGILEMIVQSSEKRVVLLPALPRKWQSGRLKGVCLKGGFEADISWEGGELKEVSLRARKDCNPRGTKIFYGTAQREVALKEAKEIVLFRKDFEV